MKNLIYTLLMLACCARVHAAENCREAAVTESKIIGDELPAHLKGKSIVIVDNATNQVQYVFKTEEFKVVRRKREVMITKELITCRKFESAPNRVSVLGGQGPTGHLDRQGNTDHTTVSTDVDFVGGVQYQRMLSERLSIGVQVQSSKTTLGVIGLDF